MIKAIERAAKRVLMLVFAILFHRGGRKARLEQSLRAPSSVLLVRPGRVEAVIQELQRMGHTPQVVAREPGRRTG